MEIGPGDGGGEDIEGKVSTVVDSCSARRGDDGLRFTRAPRGDS